MGNLVCCRCGKIIQYNYTTDINNDSHGVCVECAKKMHKEINVVYPKKDD